MTEQDQSKRHLLPNTSPTPTSRCPSKVGGAGIQPWIVFLMSLGTAALSAAATIMLPPFTAQGAILMNSTVLLSHLSSLSSRIGQTFLNCGDSLCKHTSLAITNGSAYTVMPAVLVMVFCFTTTALLNISRLLWQAINRARSKKYRTANYFTHQLSVNYSLMTRGAFTSLLSPCTTSLAMLHGLLFILIYAAIQPGQAHAPKPVIMHPSAASPCLTHIGNPLSYSGYVNDTAMLISHRSVGMIDIDDHCTYTKFRPTCFGAVIGRAPNNQVICPSLPREVTGSSTNLSLEVSSTRPRSWIPLSQSINFGRKARLM